MSTKDIDWGVQGCTTGHYYRVDATRNVAKPEYGPFAHSIDLKQKTFQFGKGKEFKTGRDAFRAANEFAISIMDESSSICISRMNFSNGYGSYLKDDHDSMFNNGWE